MKCSYETRAALNDFLLELESMIARALEDGADERALTYAVVKTLVLRHLSGDDERERDEARAEVEHYDMGGECWWRRIAMPGVDR